MWNINSYEIFTLRTPGGDRFTEFVNALIKAEAYARGVPLSAPSTTRRTNVRDGGVDTAVHIDIPANQTGWLDVPTCWQYKATENSNVSDSDLRKEIKKPHSTKLIDKNYGYRLCICDEITDEKKSRWEEILEEEITKINSSAPPPKVISASNLADWANRFPAIIIQFFKPELGQLLHLRAWQKNLTTLTPTFVDVNLWTGAKQRILEHADFNKPCSEVILAIQGEAGVGKTRLVYEALASLEGSENLVIYTAEDTKAIDVAYTLANNKLVQAILVADECPVDKRLRLGDILNGHKDRVRVICIDNSGERPSTEAEESWLQRIPKDDVDNILKQNFPNVPADRRRVYVDFSGGFIKFAADLCNRDVQIAEQGNVGSVLTSIRDYLRNRLNDEELYTVQAISLFQKVGYRDDVQEELDQLCEILDLDKKKTIRTANRLKDLPGFIAFAGRYIYVTPAIIAQVAFERAWRQWIEPNPSEFLSTIPNLLLDAFLNRVSTSSSEEVRRIVGKFFRHWAAQLQPMDLSDTSKVGRFVVLAEIHPDDYLPRLSQLIDRATKDELLQVTGGYGGTRRSLVWLAEKMATFPQFFRYAESILWKLALVETELNLGNNATRIWQQLFRIFLSGTAVPFTKRIDLLEKRLFTEDREQINLALEGLNEAFNTRGSRMVGSLVVAGRIPPENWQPQTQLEWKKCIDKALAVLLKAARSDISSLQTSALNVAIQRLSILLANGYLEQIKALFSKDTLSQEILLSLIRSLERFLKFNSDASEEVQQWLQELIPNDFHGRLIQIVGKSPWSYSFQDKREAWQEEINSMAQQLCEDQELLKSEMQWLSSPQAIMVGDLGNAMGTYDTNAVNLNMIMQSLADTEETGLARGYIVGLLRNHPQHTTIVKVNEWIDKFETQAPEIAYQLFSAGGSATKAVERALKLVDEGSLSLEYLGGFLPSLLSTEEFYQILRRLVSSVKDGENESATQTAIKLVANRLESEQRENHVSILEETKIQNLVWELLEATAQYIRGDSYDWDEILRSAAQFDVDKATKIASLGILSKNDQQKIRAEQILVNLAKSHAEVVIQRLGEVILDDEQAWRFAMGEYRFLIQNLPLNAIKQWLRSVGVDGARRIARQLALPYLDKEPVLIFLFLMLIQSSLYQLGLLLLQDYLDKNYRPVVPPLTEFVLSEFEDDEDTFRKFCIGSHSLQVYVGFMGDLSSLKSKEAEIARNFLNYPLRRVREWAQYEIDSCQRDAKRWHQMEEESNIS